MAKERVGGRFFREAGQAKSLRTRLLLWNLVVLLLMLAILGVITYILVVQRLMTDLDQQLSVQAEELSATARLWMDSGKPLDANFYDQLAQFNSPDEFSTNPVYIKLLDPASGQTLARSSNLEQEHLSFNQGDFKAALNGERNISTLAAGQQEVRVLTAPLRNRDQQVVAVIQVGESLKPMQEVQTVLLTALVLRGLLAAILYYAVGYFLITRELSPLRKLVAAMRRTNAERLQDSPPSPAKPYSSEVYLLTGAFEEMLQRLRASFTMQRDFVADVSHELRTPLTAIRGQIDVLLLDPELKADLRQDLQRVSAEMGRLSRLVTNLLTNARAETGQPPRPFVGGNPPVELDLLLVEIVRQARFLKPQVQLALGNLEQISVPGDSDMIKQVILNLVDNALSYTQAGGKVEVSLAHPKTGPSGKTGQEWALIRVKDSGPGIAPEDLPHLFERLYRADNGQSGRGTRQGSGLGLYISQLITRGHGGEITVESEPGKGSCFEVWLPCEPPTTLDSPLLPDSNPALTGL